MRKADNSVILTQCSEFSLIYKCSEMKIISIDILSDIYFHNDQNYLNSFSTGNSTNSLTMRLIVSSFSINASISAFTRSDFKCKSNASLPEVTDRALVEVL